MDGSMGMGSPAVPFALTRRAFLAGVVIALTLAGHSAANGMLPSTAGLLLAVVIAGGLTFAATARRRSWLWLFAFLMASQVLLHAVLVVSSAHSSMTMGPAPLVMTGSMALAHAGVSLLAAVVLALGDDVLLSWAALLSVALGIRLGTLPPHARRSQTVAAVTRWWARTADRAWDAARRGPPICARA